MLIYIILLFVAGALNYRKALKIEKEIAVEESEEIRKALTKSARKRRNTGNIFFVLGGILIIVLICMVANTYSY